MSAEPAQLLAIAAAVGWASGLRLYAVLFLVGLAGYLGWIPMTPGLSLLSTPFGLSLLGDAAVPGMLYLAWEQPF